MKVIEEKDFKNEISNGVVLVDFFATWCGPCKALAPVLEEVAEERKDIKIIKVDVDEANELCKEFQIMSVPTMYLFKDGKVIGRDGGFQEKENIISFIDESLK